MICNIMSRKKEELKNSLAVSIIKTLLIHSFRLLIIGLCFVGLIACEKKSFVNDITFPPIIVDKDRDGLIEIHSLDKLFSMASDLDGNGIPDHSVHNKNPTLELSGCPVGCFGYELDRSLDFSDSQSYEEEIVNQAWISAAGWQPIGSADNPWRATFEGNGFTISHLFINNGSGADIGLFGVVQSATLRNINMNFAFVNASSRGGALVGVSDSSSISQINIAADIVGSDTLGGIVGINRGNITAANFAGSITKDGVISSKLDGRTLGGIAGINYEQINRSSFVGVISGSNNIGGITGINKGRIISSFANAGFFTNSIVGGISGVNDGLIIASYSHALIGCDEEAGGLVGVNNIGASIIASYASGRIRCDSRSGGLVGMNNGSMLSSYSTVSVSGTHSGGIASVNEKNIEAIYTLTPLYSNSSGGLVDANLKAAKIQDSYWGEEADTFKGDVGHLNEGNLSGSHKLTIEKLKGCALGGASLDTANPDLCGEDKVFLSRSWSNKSYEDITYGWDFGNASEYPLLRVGNQVEPSILPIDVSSKCKLENNCPPTIHPIGDISISKSTFVYITLLGISDGGNYIQQLNFSITADNTTLFPNPFSLAYEQRRTSATLEIRPRHNRVGSSLITINVTDKDGSTAVSFRVNVLEVNGTDTDNFISIPAPPITIVDEDRDGLIEIHSLDKLFSMTSDLDGNGIPDHSVHNKNATFELSGCPVGCFGYELNRSLDFRDSRSYEGGIVNQTWISTAGWQPIGSADNPWRATFEGNGFTINHLFINQGSAADIGLFGVVNSSTIHNINMNFAFVNASLRGGALVGVSYNSSISQINIAADIAGNNTLGGIVGINRGNITEVSFAGSITRDGVISPKLDGRILGGIAGINYGQINSSSFAGIISGSKDIGGIAGVNKGKIISSFANAGFFTNSIVGGVSGVNDGLIIASYSHALIGCDEGAGGLVGVNNLDASIIASYASGRIRCDSRSGGLVGMNNGSMLTSYSTVSVSGTHSGGIASVNEKNIEGIYTLTPLYSDISGGLVEDNLMGAKIQDSYWGEEADTFKGDVGHLNEGSLLGSHKLKTEKLKGCALGGSRLATANISLMCDDVFPSRSWGNNSYENINYGWDFGNASEYPLLRVSNQVESSILPIDVSSKCKLENNCPPTIHPIGDISISQSTFVNITLLGISDGGDYTQQLNFSITADNLILFPNPLSFAYEPGSSSATLEIRPRHNRVGSSLITINVTDKDGSTIVSFRVNVLGFNEPPSFDILMINANDSNAIVQLVNISNGDDLMATEAGDDLTFTLTQITPGLITDYSFTPINQRSSNLTLIYNRRAFDDAIFAINITDYAISTHKNISINIAPGFVGLPYVFSLPHNATNPQNVVGTLNTRAYSSPVRYQLQGQDADIFIVGAVSGEITLNSSAAAPLNIVKDEYQVTAVATSAQNTSETYNATVLIQINFDNDADADGFVNNYDALPFNSTTHLVGRGEPLNPYVVYTVYQLQAMAGVDHTETLLNSSIFSSNNWLYGTDEEEQFGKHYALGGDIQAAATRSWRSNVTGGVQGFTPIGKCVSVTIYCRTVTDTIPFTGSFVGRGYTIHDLFIQRQDTDARGRGVALFGVIHATNITSVNLVGVDIAGNRSSASLVGVLFGRSRIDSVRASGSVQGTGMNCGGLVGLQEGISFGSMIINSSAEVNILCNDNGGGLVGILRGHISSSFASGNVTTMNSVSGGLVGQSGFNGNIAFSYATGSVRGREKVGGLVGELGGVEISYSYATGNVDGSDRVGGLFGYLIGDVVIANNVYATGSVTGESSVGGLAGYVQRYPFNAVYSIGQVTGGTDAGGLIGGSGISNLGQPILPNYWDISTSKQESSWAGIGLRTSQLQGCAWGGNVVSGAPLDTDCSYQGQEIFPIDQWSGSRKGGIQSGWIFSPANEYPTLYAFDISQGQHLLPSAQQQYCQRESDKCTAVAYNYAPLFLAAPYSFSFLPFNMSTGFFIGQVEAIDIEGDDFIYEILDSSLPFSVNASSGDITINGALSEQEYTIEISATEVSGSGIGRRRGSAWVRIVINELDAQDFDNDKVANAYDAFPNDSGRSVSGLGTIDEPYIINNIYQLQAIAGVDHTAIMLNSSSYTGNQWLYGNNATDQLTKHYALGQDIRGRESQTWTRDAMSAMPSGQGFYPIGNCGKVVCSAASAMKFSGSFSGNNFSIAELFINIPDGSGVALFGLIEGAQISDLILQDVSILGRHQVGAVAGYAMGVANEISSLRISGKILAEYKKNSPPSGNSVGGIVGAGPVGPGSSLSIRNSVVTAEVSGWEKVGGLVGMHNSGSVITGSYFTGEIAGSFDMIGGIVGENLGRIERSYNVGLMRLGSRISSYPAPQNAGGIAGFNSGGEIIASYAASPMILLNPAKPLLSSVNGMVGSSNPAYTPVSSYWDINISGLNATKFDSTAVSTQQLQGCSLSGVRLMDAPVNLDCSVNGAAIFTSQDWDVSNNMPSWIFSPADRYPILSLDSSFVLSDPAQQLCDGDRSFCGRRFYTSAFDQDSDGFLNDYDNAPYAPGIIGNGAIDEPYVINNVYQLQAIAGVDHTGVALDSSSHTGHQWLYGNNLNEQLSGSYELGNDITAAVTRNWNVQGGAAKGFTPIGICTGSASCLGGGDIAFRGNFAGNDWAIDGLFINRSETNFIGLFSRISDTSVENLILNNFNLQGRDSVGTLAGVMFQGRISRVNANGNLSGVNTIGGLLGAHSGGEVTSSGAITSLFGNDYIGGLVGQQSGNSKILYSHAGGHITVNHSLPAYQVGGLVGDMVGGGALIDSSYAAMHISGGGNIGGLVGVQGDSTQIIRSYAHAVMDYISYSGVPDHLGSFIGRYSAGTISGSYGYAEEFPLGNNKFIPLLGFATTSTLQPQNIIASYGVSVVPSFTRIITENQLLGCGLDGEILASVPPSLSPDYCEAMGNSRNGFLDQTAFPASSWGDRREGDILSGWIFTPTTRAPILFARDTVSDELLLPESAVQYCHHDALYNASLSASSCR